MSVCPLNVAGAGGAMVPTGPDTATALPEVVTLVALALVAALVVAAAVPETALPLVAARVAAVVAVPLVVPLVVVVADVGTLAAGAVVAVGLLPPQAARMAAAALAATPPINPRRVSFASRAWRSAMCVTLPALAANGPDGQNK
ncbi:MAG TPA: hypothetical protein VIC60_14725 [Thermomicrobiales bacterium]